MSLSARSNATPNARPRAHVGRAKGMTETTGTGEEPSEAPITPPEESGYEDVSGGETTPQSGAGSAADDTDQEDENA